MDLYEKMAREKQEDPIPEVGSQFIISIMASMYKDYKAAVDTLMESIDLLAHEVATLRADAPRPATPTPIPFPPLTTPRAPITDPSARTHLPAPPPQAATLKPTWATVARKGKRRNPPQNEPARRGTNPLTKPQQPKKAVTARSRRLIIKRKGGPLTKTMLELRDEINQALASTCVQTVAIKGNMVTLTTMESIRATSLNSRLGTFLHLIPGTVSVHLDAPVTQLLVHGLPTSTTLDTIANELTTFNTGLALTGQPRWLTTDESRAGKTASTVVISVTGPRAPDFVGRRLAAFSSTFRTERRLRFNSLTQCANCQGFAHHSNKCT